MNLKVNHEVTPVVDPCRFSNVYLLVHSTAPFVKIGKADDIVIRATTLTLSDFDLSKSIGLQVESSRDAYELEDLLHRVLKKYRVSAAEVSKTVSHNSGLTEWFRSECMERAQEFLAHIGDMVAFKRVAINVQEPVELSKQDRRVMLRRKARKMAQTQRDAPTDQVHKTGQVSALDRLRSLPAIFRGADLTVRFQWTSKKASQYLYLWGRRGLVSGLGGHSDVFFNLLVQSERDWPKAVRMAMPTGTLIGTEALRQAGWSTQIDQRPDLAVNSDQGCFTLSAFNVVSRSPAWFDTVRTGIHFLDGRGIPILRPAWALADLLRHQEWGDFGLMPDDIDWSEVTSRDHEDWGAARMAFKLDAPDLDDLVVDSRSHVPLPGIAARV